MKNVVEVVTSGFPARFGAFLESYKLNANSLAVKMSEAKGDELTDPAEVKRLGVKYGRWLSGAATPAYEGLIEVAVQYDIDMNWFMLGEGKMKRTETVDAVPVKEKNIPAVIDQEKIDMQVEIASLRIQVDMLKAENAKVWRLALPPQLQRELDFLRSSSHTTVEEVCAERNRIGYVINEKNKKAVEVEAPILVLDSLDNVRPMYDTAPVQKLA